MNRQQLILIVAAEKNRGIGKDGTLPWPRLAEDHKFFVKMTTGCCVVMGRKTWESIPLKFRPLVNRQNIIISSNYSCPNGVIVVPNLEAAIQASTFSKIFIIGGEQLYREAIHHRLTTRIYYTHVNKEFPCDRFFPELPNTFQVDPWFPVQNHSLENFSYDIRCYRRIHDENQYLDLIRTVLKAPFRDDRTGVGTYSIFGTINRYSLRNMTMPLLTTKNVFWKGVAEELLWFISGSSDASVLSEKHVKIWDANSNRQTLDKLGMTTRAEGDCGPGYGFQWRHWGAKYIDHKTDYSGQGVDQLQQLIRKIKTMPSDRRLILSSWNVEQIPEMVLPPCHVMCQFYVSGKELSCTMFQR